MKKILCLALVMTMCLSGGAVNALPIRIVPDDYTPVMPDNMIASPTEAGSYTWTGGGVLIATSSNQVKFTMNDSTAMKDWDPCGSFLSYSSSKLTIPFKSNTKYVVSARVKIGAESTASSVQFAFGIGKYDNTVKNVMSVSGTDWMDYKAVITSDSDAVDDNLQIGIPRTETTVGASVVVDRTEGNAPYIAEEVPYDIINSLSGDSCTVSNGDVVNFEASIINQIGLDYSGEQGKFTWYILNEDKTAYADGFTVSVNEDTRKASITIGNQVVSGKYHVVAVSNDYPDFIKTQTLFIKTFDDYIPDEKPENLIKNPTRSGTYKYSGGNAGIDTTSPVNELIFIRKEGADKTWDPSGAILTSSGDSENEIELKAPFESNTAYVVSTRVKNLAPDVASNVRFGVGIGKWSTAPVVMEVTGNRWLDYKEVIISDDNAEGDYLQFGIPLAESTIGAKVSMDLNEGYQPYIAKEVLYDITNRVIAGTPVLSEGVGGAFTAKAEIVNQIGICGTLEQGDFNWVVLNDRNQIFNDGITVTQAADTSEVIVDVSPDVSRGAYRLVAESDKYDGYCRTLWVYVTDGSEKLSIYVSPDGNDFDSGLISSPVKTIECAQKRVSQLKKSGVSCEVVLRDGEYRIEEQLRFSDKDSGIPSAPVVYRSHTGEKAILKGSVTLDTGSAQPVTDSAILERIHPDAKGKILEIDLEAQGIDREDIFDAENNPFNIMDMLSCGEYNSFFVDGVEQEIAHWPNGRHYSNFEKWEFDGWNENGWTAENRPKTLYYEEYDTAPNRWGNAKNWWIVAYSRNDFVNVRMSVESIDVTERSITLKEMALNQEGMSGYFTNRWQAYNLLEEMDIPGEYYIDRNNMKLYFYPPYDLNNSELEISLMSVPMMELRDAHDITFKDMQFSQTNHHGVMMTDVNNVDFEGCEFNYISGTGICATGSIWAKTQSDWGGTKNRHWQQSVLDGSYNVDIKNNTFYKLGGSSIDISGGNVDTLTPSNNVIQNNSIFRTGQKRIWQSDAVVLRGVGNLLKQNEIGGIPNTAVRMFGNDHIVEYNEIYDVIQEVSDAAAIYRGGNEIGRGDIVRYNYIHDFDVTTEFYPHNSAAFGKLDRTGSRIGVYWDGSQHGGTAENNIFYNIPRDLNSNESSATTHRYNISIDVPSPVRLHEGSRTEMDWSNQGTRADAIDTIADKELYFAHYPALERWASGENSAYDSIYEKNLFVDCAAPLYGNNILDSDDPDDKGMHWRLGRIQNNVELEGTDIFVSAELQDFRLKSEAPVASQIPELLSEYNFNMNDIGIQRAFVLDDTTAPFRLLYPNNGVMLTKFDEVEFVWQEALGATKYRLIIATDAAMDNIVVDKTTEFNTMTVESLEAGMKYYWKILASNSSRNHTEVWNSLDGVNSFSTSGVLVQEFIVDKTSEAIHVKATVANANGIAAPDDFSVFLGFYGDDEERRYAVFQKNMCDELHIDEMILLSEINVKRIELFIYDKNLKPQYPKTIYQSGEN